MTTHRYVGFAQNVLAVAARVLTPSMMVSRAAIHFWSSIDYRRVAKRIRADACMNGGLPPIWGLSDLSSNLGVHGSFMKHHVAGA